MSLHAHTKNRPGRPPLGRVVLVVVASALILGGACLWVTVLAPPAAQRLVLAYGIAVSAVAVLCVVAAMYGSEAARHRRALLMKRDEEASRFTGDTLPTVVRQLRDDASVDTVLAEHRPSVTGAYGRLLELVVHEIGDHRRMRAAAMAACGNAAGRVQALSTSMLAALREMEETYGEEVLGDLLKLDHNTAQTGRLADSIAVLTGVRSGRRWTKPIVVESILRGAVGRISGYQRVRVHSASTAAIAGYAAEGVMHALAELMDNAASFSPPSEEVHVYVEELQAGLAIAIEDGGLGMKPGTLRRAEAAVSSEPLDLTSLSGTRLGLAVVGCLARKHGLNVFFRPSSRGGTGVVMMIPAAIIEFPRKASAPTPERGWLEPAQQDPQEPPDWPTSETTPVQPAVLPKRRRGQTLAAASSTPATSGPPAPRPRSDASARFREFRMAARSGTKPPPGGAEDDA